MTKSKSLSTTEQANQLSSVQKKVIITNTEYPLFKNIPHDQQEASLRKMIVVVCGILGIKNLPDENVMPFLLRFIREHFGSLSCEAMIQAFELNALCEFGEKKHEHFQCISIEFLAAVLGDYIMLKRNTYKEFKQLAAPKDIDIDETPESVYETLIDFVKRKNQIPIVWNWGKVYSHMEKAGLITEDNKWKTDFYEKIKAKVQGEVYNEKLKLTNIIERNNAEKPLQLEQLVNRCRKEYVIMKLKELLQPLTD